MVRTTGERVLHVLEPGPVSAADVSLVRGDPAHIVRVFLGQIGVELGERAAHLQRVFLVDAEDDRLCESVGLAHEADEVPGDGPGPRLDCDQTLEVRGVVLGVRDRSPVPIDLALAWAPSGGIVVGDDTMHAEGGEKSVINALGEAVFVDRIAEVRVGVDVVLSAWCCGHADLGCGLEPLQDLAPVAVVAGAAPMALVDDDEIEEVLRVLPIETRPTFVAGDALIGREVHIAALRSVTAAYLVACISEDAEVLRHRVVHEHVAVGEKEHLRPACGVPDVPAGGPELPGNLESDGGLPRSGAQRQQDALTPRDDGLDGTVDGDLLVVPQRPASVPVGRGQQPLGRCTVHKALRHALPPPELLGRWKCVEGPFHAGRVVDLDDFHAVRRIGELEAECFGVVTRLLEALCGVLVARLRLNYGYGEMGSEPQDVIGALLSSAACPASDEHDSSVGEGPLFVDRVRRIVPARFPKHGDDELAAGVSFGLSHRCRDG